MNKKPYIVFIEREAHMTEGSYVIINDPIDWYFGRKAKITRIEKIAEIDVATWEIPSGYGNGVISGASRLEKLELVKEN